MYHIIINSIYTCLYIMYVTYGYEYSDTQSHAAVLYLVLKAIVMCQFFKVSFFL